MACSKNCINIFFIIIQQTHCEARISKSGMNYAAYCPYFLKWSRASHKIKKASHVVNLAWPWWDKMHTTDTYAFFLGVYSFCFIVPQKSKGELNISQISCKTIFSIYSKPCQKLSVVSTTWGDDIGKWLTTIKHNVLFTREMEHQSFNRRLSIINIKTKSVPYCFTRCKYLQA